MIKRRRGRTVKRLRRLACAVEGNQAPHKYMAKWVASEQLQATLSNTDRVKATPNESKWSQVTLSHSKQSQVIRNSRDA